MSESIVIPVDLGDAVPRPKEHHIARQGPRRLVKLAPVLAGAPIIWTSPYVLEEDIDGSGVKQACRVCIVLVQRDPLPETMRVRIPLSLYDKLHDVPVEW
jgi:hypothetical protein